MKIVLRIQPDYPHVRVYLDDGKYIGYIVKQTVTLKDALYWFKRKYESRFNLEQIYINISRDELFEEMSIRNYVTEFGNQWP